ncbi:MAG: SDR family oxidoreductase [Candidatus Zixiibacteriota bacterium]|nr:MAG: SDR family oxidoreductase [candidate division Zixibacteria bacterium]
MNYLVTGGAGFIGSNLAAHLHGKGEKVRILDNFSTGRRENVKALEGKVEIVEGDIRDESVARKAATGMDYILHQAALPSVPRSVEDPVTSNAVNIDGTLNMLEAAREAGVKKFVMASSSSVYGESEELPKHEKLTPDPLSPYAVTKLTNEYYLKIYWELYRLPTVALRYFNIFGPHQDPGSDYAAVIPRFITDMLDGRQPVVFGDGGQSRDFTYIDNCVQANLLAATNDDIVGDYFNVGCGAQFTLNQMLNFLREIIGTDLKAKYDPPREGDILHSFASIDKLQKFGYKPDVDFKEGLRRTVDFFRSQR